MIYHVLPINDLEPHIEKSTCKCHPKVIFENGHMIIIHNSFDDRESREKVFENFHIKFSKS